jgi:hypothetical protein
VIFNQSNVLPLSVLFSDQSAWEWGINQQGSKTTTPSPFAQKSLFSRYRFLLTVLPCLKRVFWLIVLSPASQIAQHFK